ncbi:uncharacterized protein PHALS_03507 [Plasmopara halstedii]|uniref:Uncharacterized protein n=1 Tax=Plasmopara halstedii TaxID=4781 RepID=A0A0N7L7E2_PLAHL|nr:uncharacterized protein PHALS_03507 [Plasmopara halstedii]CEG46827.1 hypothetical protein PHALS_03507 [Plasmopara halstedii]|eukprot:XP_024583196.1 hypothetical protein PHALS_03507 [Plasmopara halstedii]
MPQANRYNFDASRDFLYDDPRDPQIESTRHPNCESSPKLAVQACYMSITSQALSYEKSGAPLRVERMVVY